MTAADLERLKTENAALAREVARQRSLVEASHSLHSTLDQDELLGIILETASKAVDAERGTVYLMSADGKEIWSRVVAGTEPLVIRLPLGKGIAGAVAKTGDTIRIDDAYADSRFDPSTDKRSGYRTRSILCAPIKNRKGHVVGVFQLLNRRGGPFEKSDVEYLDALSVHAALAIENAVLHRSSLEKERQDREIKVAQEIQRQLQPERADLRVASVDLSGMNELCEDASGDYYDFFDFPNGRTGVALGDVSGHGLGAAMVMAEARALLRAFARTVDDLPSMMALLNDFLSRDMTAGKFMSLFVAAIDTRTGEIDWCSAGHNPPVLWKAETKSFVALDATGPVLGVVPGATYGVGATVLLKPGDAMLLYTDGATEAPDANGDLFGEERLQELVRDAADSPSRGIIDAVRAALRKWTGGAPNRDDLTLVAVKAVP